MKSYEQNAILSVSVIYLSKCIAQYCVYNVDKFEKIIYFNMKSLEQNRDLIKCSQPLAWKRHKQNQGKKIWKRSASSLVSL